MAHPPSQPCAAAAAGIYTFATRLRGSVTCLFCSLVVSAAQLSTHARHSRPVACCKHVVPASALWRVIGLQTCVRSILSPLVTPRQQPLLALGRSEKEMTSCTPDNSFIIFHALVNHHVSLLGDVLLHHLLCFPQGKQRRRCLHGTMSESLEDLAKELAVYIQHDEISNAP